MKFRFLSSLLLASCASYTAAVDIYDIIGSEDYFSTLATALGEANLASTFDEWWYCEYLPNIRSCQKYTVFAPTDDSFNTLPDGTLERILSVEFRPHLKDFLLYHVLEDVVISSSDADNDDNIRTMNGETISLVKDSNVITINSNAIVTKPDLDATNGVVHGINNVLLPTSATKNIAEVATTANFNRLVELLVTAGLDAYVSNSDNILTVFAPTDAAFQKYADDGFDLNNVNAVANLLKYHVITNEIITEEDLKQRDEITTLQGGSISVTGHLHSRKIELNGGDIITSTDILASNGIIHVINTVLVPPKDIFGIASDNPDFSILVSALESTSLSQSLQEEGPFTVFAPTNAAFQKYADDGFDLDDVNAVANLLKYHVITNEIITEEDLKWRDEITTLQGGSISVDVTGHWRWPKIELNGGDIITSTDILASNGIIHVINTVLIPL